MGESKTYRYNETNPPVPDSKREKPERITSQPLYVDGFGSSFDSEFGDICQFDIDFTRIRSTICHMFDGQRRKYMQEQVT